MNAIIAIGLLLTFGLLAGCGHQDSSGGGPQVVNKHEHKPPHGGTPVELGHEEYHVELVLDPADGKLRAYVMDGELENFIRIKAESFEIDARLANGPQPLIFKPVANRATGETVGDTSLFEAQADWLKATNSFDASLKEISVRGTTYRDIQFNFPKGNDQDGGAAQVQLSSERSSSPAALRGEPIDPSRPGTNSDSKPTTLVEAKTTTPGVAPSNSPSRPQPDDADAKTRGYVKAGFDELSAYTFDLTPEMAAPEPSPASGHTTNSISEQISAQIPDRVKAFNGKQVATSGFMLPIKVDHGLVTEFLLLKNQSACCFGIPPKINEWVDVRMAGKGVKAMMDQTITVCGTLNVGEYRENGYLVGIYRMAGDKVETQPWTSP